MKTALMLPAALVALVGCNMPAPTPAPTLGSATQDQEKEYIPFLAKGTSAIKGQAFLTTKGGDVKVAAGREVWLDPVTAYSMGWFTKAGCTWQWRELLPPSKTFLDARRQTVADAEGRFEFRNLPAGTYYVRTTVTWEVPSLGTQGGLLHETVTISSGETKALVMHTM